MKSSYLTRRWMFVAAMFSIMCGVVLLILQLIPKGLTSLKKENTYAIEIMPSFTMNVEWLDLLVVMLYTAGLTALNTSYIRWYMIPLTVFVAIQLVYSTWQLLDRESYIQDQLELSWQSSYMNNRSVLKSIQEQWQCRGFKSLMDRPAALDQNNIVQSACYPILLKSFGSTVFLWGVGLWLVKLIQAMGLLACYALYLHTTYDFTVQRGDNAIENSVIILIEESYQDDSSVDDEDETVLIELKQQPISEEILAFSTKL